MPLPDSALAAALAAVSVVAAAPLGAGGVVASLLLCAPLALRRALPEHSGGAVAAAALLQLAFVGSPLFADVAVLVALFSLAAHARPWAARGGLGLALLGAFLAPVRYFLLPGDGVGVTLTAVVVTALLALAAWALGSLRRAAHQNELTRAERARLLENERANELRMAATDERQRIAREVHDVVAHSLAVIVAQADGGRYVAAADPPAAAAVLATISGTGRQALADMRNLLGVLREGPGDERAPQPDARAIPGLVDQVRASGLDVTVERTGRERDVSPAVGLAAYRIVQESLTNVLKHAGPRARARVEVRWDDDALRVGVDDDGYGAASMVQPGTGGQGLVGMTERARLHGGAVVARPRPGGGFSVRATLPYSA